MPLPLDNQICFTLYTASMVVGRTYKPLLDDMGITYPQYLVLCALGEGGEMTIGAIAERLGLESSTVTPLVKRIEQTGLVERRRSRTDERQVFVDLTSRGHAILERCNCLGETLIRLSGMTLDELERLNGQIRGLLGTMASRAP